MRAVFETLGIQDIVAKSIGTSNPHNMIKATFAALKAVQAPRAVAAKRGKRMADIVTSKRNKSDTSSKAVEAAEA
jgi:small subunit ribosomal protein S5